MIWYINSKTKIDQYIDEASEEGDDEPLAKLLNIK